MTAPAKQQHDRPRHASPDTVELLERALRIAESASHDDIVEQWKSQVLRTLRQERLTDEARGLRFAPLSGLLAKWLEGIGRAHDGALGVERRVAEAEALLQADDPTGALHVAQRALAHALLGEYRTRLWLVTAWAGVGQRDPFMTHAALQQLPARALSVELVTAYLTTCNRADEATTFLLEARGLGHRSRVASKQFIELLALRGATQEASRLALEDRHLLSECDLRALADAGFPSH